MVCAYQVYTFLYIAAPFRLRILALVIVFMTCVRMLTGPEHTMSCCPDTPSAPGQCRILVSRANVDRNRIDGSPGTLPSIVVEHEGRRHHAVRVVCEGAVVFQQADDPTAKPYIWAETAWDGVTIIHAHSKPK